jgi:hypothetical protein
MRRLMRFHALATPALAVDDTVKVAGRVRPVEELHRLLEP